MRYPFSAIVGQESMRTALLVNAVDPSIGGLLISGQKGTAKTTAVRALAELLPHIEVVRDCLYHCSPTDSRTIHESCRRLFDSKSKIETQSIPMPLVELPLGATEDRLVGTLQIERAVKDGERVFEPGLLAQANRGILYVDEVNLLEDHLVDVLLDASVSGINVVEREGLSLSHPARFLLIGTMNPEEGDLRPQFLDRFGLWVCARGETQIERRRTVISRRLAFESDPISFARAFAEEERKLRERVVTARRGLEQIVVPEAIFDAAIGMSLKAQVHGHRADIALIKTARALSSLVGEREVGIERLWEAAHYVLPHRIPNLLNSEPERISKAIDDIVLLVDASGFSSESYSQPDFDDAEADELMLESMQIPGSMAAGSILFSAEKKSP